MSALIDYVSELERQAELFDMASSFDDAMLTMERPPVSNGGRHWTRQDRNRLECEWRIDEIEGQGLPFDEWERAIHAIPKRRMHTRLGIVLRRCRGAIRPLHDAAILEAENRGIYSTLAPMLVEALEAHRRLVGGYSTDDGPDDWHDVKRRHEAAVCKLRDYLPAEERDPPKTTNARRGRRKSELRLALESAPDNLNMNSVQKRNFKDRYNKERADRPGFVPIKVRQVTQTLKDIEKAAKKVAN